ncbi:sulfatase family protein [Planctomicrobium sp. SH661]|uniref:sulfatase family protein n=1 Tax=Planctomicrobium sp. SH661 TaxID=3448124 RepID=UPI003F5C07B8
MQTSLKIQIACFSAAVLLMSVAVAEAVPAPVKRQPNVLLILVDDLGYADLGCHGSKTAITPNIDSIAAAGIRFTDGYVTAPQCGPSRAGLMTGVYQQRFGFEANPQHEYLRTFGLPPARLTMAERLSAAGLATMGVGKWDLGAVADSQPWTRGFDEFQGFYTGSRSFYPIVDDNESSYNRYRKSATQLLKESGHLTEQLTDAAIACIKAHQSKPFFMYVSYNAPHWPMEPKPEHLERFEHIEDLHRRSFLALLYGVDQEIGRLLATLAELQLEEETLVVFLSDNGGPTGHVRSNPKAPFQFGQNTSLNDPFRGVKGDVYEGGIRVPFFMQWKGQFEPGTLFHHPVSSLDLIPTALAAVGADVPEAPELDGVNLLPHLRGEDPSPPHDVLYWRWMGQLAIRKDQWKFVKLPEKAGELYDLSSDPGEKSNLAAAHPDIATALLQSLKEWNEQLPEPKWRTPQQSEMLKRSYSADVFTGVEVAEPK